MSTPRLLWSSASKTISLSKRNFSEMSEVTNRLSWPKVKEVVSPLRSSPWKVTSPKPRIRIRVLLVSILSDMPCVERSASFSACSAAGITWPLTSAGTAAGATAGFPASSWHILLMYLFLSVLIGGAMWKLIEKSRRWAYAVVALLLFQALSSTRAVAPSEKSESRCAWRPAPGQSRVLLVSGARQTELSHSDRTHKWKQT